MDNELDLLKENEELRDRIRFLSADQQYLKSELDRLRELTKKPTDGVDENGHLTIGGLFRLRQAELDAERKTQ